MTVAFKLVTLLGPTLLPVAAAYLLALESAGVSLVGAIPAGMPSLSMPDRDLLLLMWPAAVGIALMSFTESIAAARVFRREGEARVVSNQELVATGVGNLVSGFFGAMPSGGGTSQTAVNVSAGARTQLSGVVLALIALATMLFLAPLLGKMPHATLAAVVIVYSVGLISPAEMQAILRVRAIAGGPFQTLPLPVRVPCRSPTTPAGIASRRFGLVPLRLAATGGVSVDFHSSGY